MTDKTGYTIAASDAAFQKALSVMPGGVSSPVRAFKAVGGTPIFIKSAQGCTLTDVDGNSYIDYVGSYGPLIVGHANEQVVAALSKAIGRGTSFGMPTESETQLATLITSALPAVEMLRFVNSGTEAVMSAIRLARAVTGRSRVVKCVGGYHGHSDALLVQAGSGMLTLSHKSGDDQSIPASAGVPAEIAATTLLTQYNNIEDARALFDRHGREIACFLVEPVAGNMGVVPPTEGYLAELRSLCTHHGAMLIFDEVMTGFRVAWGGAQVRYNIQPDITTLGKVIGGGLPVGAYGASRAIMQQVAPAGPVYQAGTLSGNPLAMAGGLATLDILKDPATYEQLETAAGNLAEGLIDAASEAKVPVAINRVGSMLTVFFLKAGASPEVSNYAQAAACDTDAYRRFFHSMLTQGVHLPPSQFEAWFLSLSHDAAVIEKTLVAASRAFASLTESAGS